METEQRFGRLVMMEDAPRNKRARFHCDCGITKWMTLKLVLEGRAKSCGCARGGGSWMQDVRIQYGGICYRFSSACRVANVESKLVKARMRKGMLPQDAFNEALNAKISKAALKARHTRALTK